MRIGISTAQCGQLARPAAVRAVAMAAEQVGYASVWVLDRAVTRPGPEALPPVLDPMGVIAASAAVTTRVRLGVSVQLEPSHHPMALARALATLDVLSEGRLSISLGVDRTEGYPMEQVEGTLDGLDRGWSVTSLPRPVQSPRPPVLLAGHDHRTLARVASGADGWNPPGLPREAIAAMRPVVVDHLERTQHPELQGGPPRAPASVSRSVFHGSRAYKPMSASTADVR